MELTGKITENQDPRSLSPNSVVNKDQYLRMAALDCEFSNWYARLPETLKWTPANITTAPFSFFLLHQQYHSSLISLHWPFALYEEHPSQSQEGRGNSPSDHFSALSRTVCTKHAIRVSRIFWHHRQRFDTKQIFSTGLQHAVHSFHPNTQRHRHTNNPPQGTAATALLAALSFPNDPLDRTNTTQHLEYLSASLTDMAQTYQPAARMSAVLRAVLLELREHDPSLLTPPPNPDHDSKLLDRRSTAAVIPLRRGFATSPLSHTPAYKTRHQTSHSAGASKRRSMSMAGPTTTTTGSPPNLDFTVKPPFYPPHFTTNRSDVSAWNHALPSPTSPFSTTTWTGPLLDLDLNLHAPTSTPHLTNTSTHVPATPTLTEPAVGGDASYLDFLILHSDETEWAREGGLGGAGGRMGTGVGGCGFDGVLQRGGGGGMGMGFGGLF